MKRIYVFAMALCCMAQWASSQELKQYSGRYLQGEAEYGYYENADGQRIKHGKYRYQAEIGYGGSEEKVIADGTFKNDKKEGEWTFQIASNKEQVVIKARYADGVLNGLFQVQKGGRVVWNCEMKNGRITGDFQRNFYGKKLSGSFDAEGYPVREWKCLKQDSKGIEIYQEGVLLKGEETDETTGNITKRRASVPAEINAEDFFAAYNATGSSVKINGHFYQLSDEKNPGGAYPHEFERLMKEWVRYTERHEGLKEGAEPYAGIPYRKIIADTQSDLAEEYEGMIFQVVERMPQFPGGQQALFAYMDENLRYPEAARKSGKKGMVMLQFIVNTDGSLSDITVVRSVNPDMDKEAIRLVSTMPKWKPGMQRGIPVRVKYTLPINFRLPSKE